MGQTPSLSGNLQDMGMCHEQPSSGWEEGWMLLLGHPLVKWHFIKKSHYWELEIVPARPVQITAQVLAVAVWMSVRLLLCCVAPSTWCTAWDLYHGWVRRRRNCFRSMGTCCQAGVLTRHWGRIKKKTKLTLIAELAHVAWVISRALRQIVVLIVSKPSF